MINDLYQREPKAGYPVSEKTEFFFLYDHNNIYIGIHCFDDPKGITAKELARDVSLGEDDRVQIIRYYINVIVINTDCCIIVL